jgi:hypothetical protein
MFYWRARARLLHVANAESSGAILFFGVDLHAHVRTFEISSLA